MKEKGTHEGCIEQMERLFAERLFTGGNSAAGNVPVDSEGRIRIDDLELTDDVQNEVNKRMATITEENLSTVGDLVGYKHDFLATNGFDVEGVDYDNDVAFMNKID
jgi:enoyl-[acyl-carrier protein] reductase/trans-2-enoyl-CoA reductase (NAD+)